MKAIQRAWSQFPYQDVLLNLDAEQHEAVLMLLMLTTVVDERVTREELDTLVIEMAALPFFSEHIIHRVLGEESFALRSDMQERISKEGEVRDIVHRVRDDLRAPEQRKAALLLVAILLGIDGVDEAESDFCLRVGDLLGLPEQEVDETLRYAWEQVSPSSEALDAVPEGSQN